MDAHQRQQFDVLVAMATDRLAERLEQRHEGAEGALALLRADAAGTARAVDEFTAALCRDALVDNADGAAWVLAALARRPAPDAAALAGARTTGDALQALARAALAALLRDRVAEELERRAAFGARLLAGQA